MQITNAIAWAHFQLRGGWRNLLTTSLAYLVIVGALILASLRIDPTASGQILSAWTMGLMGLQVGTLVLYGCWSVSAAVRKDVTTHMIESHRLMPVSGVDAIAGFVLGPACQAIALSAVNLALGIITSQAGSFTAVSNWLTANLVLWVFAVCAWVVLAFLPLVMPVGSRILIGLVWVVVIGHQMVPSLFPGLFMLAGPAARESVFGIVAGGKITLAHQISMSCQMLVAVLCFAGAARKYQRDDVLTFGPLLGLVVLAAYVAISVVGVSLWPEFEPKTWRVERVPPEVQMLTATIGGLLAGLLPVSAASWEYARWERAQRLRDPAPRRRPGPTLLVVATAALIAALLPRLVVLLQIGVVEARARRGIGPALWSVVHSTQAEGNSWRTLAIVFAFLLSVSYLMRICYRTEAKTRWIVGLFIGFTWLGPAFVDFIMNGAMQGFTSEEIFSAVSSCSPPIALIYIWGDIGITADPGIVFQALTALGLAALYHLPARRKKPATA